MSRPDDTGLLARAAAQLSKLLAQTDPEGMAGLKDLDGTLLRVELIGLPPFLMAFQESGFELVSESDREPDLALSGSLVAMMRAGLSGELDAGVLNVSGDVALAQRLRRALDGIRPDPEEFLAARVGDVAAHHLASLGRQAVAWGRDAGAALGADVRDYLQEESRLLAPRIEVEHFKRAVEDLRDDVERLAARMAQLDGDPPGGAG